MRHYDQFDTGNRIVTRSRTITEADIVNFAGLSGDWHPLHTDAEFARCGPFGERIAHGFLVLAVASGLMPLAEMAVLAFYGMDKVQFRAPARIGDTLRVIMEVSEMVERDAGRGVVTFQTTVQNQRDQAVAVFAMKLLLGRLEVDAVTLNQP